ncbi:LysE family translocator [Agrobacterium vitis]|uniref:LysE family translocator n=2 Tax=Agrobacterium vitis TaxID=373 RepID=A0AAE5AX35_AGRVI|nr:LysE family translocator [Agrobacterium vitis]MCF1499900.1 LysE family translocator [Allorhizobium sp. Av2]MCM2442887.1 LysE family translocator [Agrobacterium vitis]MUZ58825.1 LysE family translocator [Agrobacterium vitis]MVA66460.1 LysE family translocator [Agrobacterium vitis]MVA88497.1 LysE family translocator [Agrobacterium vitis]
MELTLILKSIVLGLAVAAPLGPIGALCINRTLERGFWAGVAGGFGTALADAVYASLAALGFSAFAATLATIDTPLKIIGGLFMVWLGWKSLKPKPLADAAKVGARDLFGTIAATFFLTITNPVTILSFAAIFAGLGLADASGATNAFFVVAGVFLGSLLWWFLLSGGIALAQQRLPSSFARWVSRLSGLILISFGLFALGSIAWGMIAR